MAYRRRTSRYQVPAHRTPLVHHHPHTSLLRTLGGCTACPSPCRHYRRTCCRHRAHTGTHRHPRCAGEQDRAPPAQLGAPRRHKPLRFSSSHRTHTGAPASTRTRCTTIALMAARHLLHRVGYNGEFRRASCMTPTLTLYTRQRAISP